MSEFASKRNRISPADEESCVNNIRVLSADMVEKANSGHPGAPMGCAPIAHVLFGSMMNFSPTHPKWFNRDRFVLSNGHACALLYSMLHLTGYDIPMEQLQKFRQLGSITPGHPENFATPGVEVSTGPLGQGISNAVGLAIAEKHLAACFNKDGFNLVDHYTYVICGDGCLQEGVSAEACSLAGHLGLGKLIVCYDDNHITIDGDTKLSFSEDVKMRYEAYGWQVLTVDDGNDLNAVEAALLAGKADTERPTLIKIRTVIGHGSTKAGTHGVHGAPLGATDLAQVKTRFGFDATKTFEVRSSVYDYYRAKVVQGEQAVAAWEELFSRYATAHPDLAADLSRRINGQLPDNWKATLPKYALPEAKAAATRNRSEEVLNALGPCIPELLGGSADLTSSNLTFLKCTGDFQKHTPAGRYIRFGVREHGMAAICNGLFAHGGIRPYCATFLNFIGYAMGAVRVAALSRMGIIYVMTHDSIGLGEDGPTHQPVEMLECLRATPNLFTIRPADGNETAGAYAIALEHAHTPTVISLSRQAAPTMEGTTADKVALGAYVLHDLHTGDSAALAYPTLTIIGTGTELNLAVQTARSLLEAQTAKGATAWIRVVSMPCWELFEAQTLDYQRGVFLPGSPVMSIEAGGIHGWRRFSHVQCGIPHVYGQSAPADQIYKYFGLTVPQLVDRALHTIEFYTPAGANQPDAHSLLDFPIFPPPPPLHH